MIFQGALINLFFFFQNAVIYLILEKKSPFKGLQIENLKILAYL